MTATHWIAIAAIITPFITSWSQYWLSERRKRLDAANPATTQPKVTILDDPDLTFLQYMRLRWRRALIQWLASWSAVNVILIIYFSARPLSGSAWLMLFQYVVLLVALFTIRWESN